MEEIPFITIQHSKLQKMDVQMTLDVVVFMIPIVMVIYGLQGQVLPSTLPHDRGISRMDKR